MEDQNSGQGGVASDTRLNHGPGLRGAHRYGGRHSFCSVLFNFRGMAYGRLFFSKHTHVSTEGAGGEGRVGLHCVITGAGYYSVIPRHSPAILQLCTPVYAVAG